MNPVRSGSSAPLAFKPSMAVIARPSRLSIRRVQEKTGSPSISTMHAPQMRSSCCRGAQRSGYAIDIAGRHSNS
jgi:hypothetical protein